MSSKVQPETPGRQFEAIRASNLFMAIRDSLSGHIGSHILDRAVKAGDMAPMFRLPDAKSEVIELSNLLRKGPVVISFFWGDWCAFCNLSWEELAVADTEIKAQGATLIGISPHLSAGTLLSGRHQLLPCPLLKDRHCKVARRYGVAFPVPREKWPTYASLGYPALADGPPGDWFLPISATYVIETTGRILFSYLDADYRTRLEPAEIILVLRRLRERPALPMMLSTRRKVSGSHAAPGNKRDWRER